MSQGKIKTFVCSYFHDNAQWGLKIYAYDRQDAEVRCQKLGLKLDGELVAEFPAKLGWIAKCLCFIRNNLNPS